MGDMHGAALIRTLLDEASLGKNIIEIYAIGGQRMKNSGAILIGGWRVNQISSSHMAFLGPVFSSHVSELKFQYIIALQNKLLCKNQVLIYTTSHTPFLA